MARPALPIIGLLAPGRNPPAGVHRQRRIPTGNPKAHPVRQRRRPTPVHQHYPRSWRRRRGPLRKTQPPKDTGGMPMPGKALVKQPPHPRLTQILPLHRITAGNFTLPYPTGHLQKLLKHHGFHKKSTKGKAGHATPGEKKSADHENTPAPGQGNSPTIPLLPKPKKTGNTEKTRKTRRRTQKRGMPRRPRQAGCGAGEKVSCRGKAVPARGRKTRENPPFHGIFSEDGLKLGSRHDTLPGKRRPPCSSRHNTLNIHWLSCHHPPFFRKSTSRNRVKTFTNNLEESRPVCFPILQRNAAS